MNTSKIFAILSFVLFNAAMLAQTPYSRIGLGLPDEYATARLKGMSSLGIGLYSNDFINYVNPATLGKIELTRFQTDVAFRGMFLSSASKKGYLAQTDFEGVVLAFPVYKPWGISFSAGLVPFTRVDYTIKKTFNGTGSIGSYDIENTGVGGISTGYGAFSYLLPYDFSVGFRANYYFGQVENTVKSKFLSDAATAQFINVTNIDGFGFALGIISPDVSRYLNISRVSDAHAGFAVDFFPSLSIDTMLILRSTFREDSTDLLNGSLSVPLKVSGGVSFSYNNNLKCLADFSYQNMSKLERFGKTDKSVDAAYRLGAGVEYSQSREAGSTAAPLQYRLGGAFEKLPITISGAAVHQYSLSGGISLPLNRSNFLDVSLSYINRFGGNDKLHSENIFQVNTSLNLSELWFITQER